MAAPRSAPASQMAPPVDQLPPQCQFGDSNTIPQTDCCPGCSGLGYPYFQYYDSRQICWCFLYTNSLIISDLDSWVGQSESAGWLPAACLPPACRLPAPSDVPIWRLMWLPHRHSVRSVMPMQPEYRPHSGRRPHPPPAASASTQTPHRARLRRQGVSALPPPALAACRLSAPHAT